MRTAIAFTTWNRPHYLEESLDSWLKVRGIEQADLIFRCEPGNPEVVELAHLADFGHSLTITVNDTQLGESRNPWQAMQDAFEATEHQFAICAEDDDVVADDILEYFDWAAARFADDHRVLAVCAFQHYPVGRPHEARLEQFFQPWIWGTWRDRWQQVLAGDWDFDYSHKGFDWYIREHHVQEAGRYVVFPCRSRSIQIGREGVHFRPSNFDAHVSRAFSPHYEPGSYTVAGLEEEQAAVTSTMDKGAPRDPGEVEERLWEDARGQVGFDVGSNMGQSVHKMVGRFGLVVAFEPASESYAVLENDWGAQGNVRCFQMALSDHEGSLTTAVRAAPIYTGQLTATGMPYEGEHQDEPRTANWGAEVGQREVDCSTLDKMADMLAVSVDFVKIDTEGHELQVLQGAGRVLAEDKPRLLVEFHSADLRAGCVELLEAAGYQVETVRHPHYAEGSYMYDMHGWLRAAQPEREAMR